MEFITQIIDDSVQMIERGEYRAATKKLTAAYQDSPNNDDILVLLTEALSEQGRSKQAVDLLLKRYSQGEVSDEVVFALGDEYFALADYDNAQIYYKLLLERETSVSEAWVRIGLVAGVNGDDKEAKNCFQKSLSLDDANLNAMNSLGDLALDNDQLDEAKGWFNRVLEFDAEDPEAASNLADLHYEDGELELAKKFATQAVKFDSSYAAAWLTLGYVALDSDDEEQARTCFKTFLGLEQSDDAADIIVEVKAVLSALKD